MKKRINNEYQLTVTYNPNFEKLSQNLGIASTKSNKRFNPFSFAVVFASIIALIFTTSYILKSMLITNPKNSGDNSGHSATNVSFAYKSSMVVSEFGVDPYFSNYDTPIIIDSSDKVDEVIDEYGAIFSQTINEAIESVVDDHYFENYNIIISPFLYSSSEQEIVVQEVLFYYYSAKFEVVFSLFSGQKNDNDINAKFYLISIEKTLFNNFSSINIDGKLVINNTYDGSSKSVYYK